MTKKSHEAAFEKLTNTVAEIHKQRVNVRVSRDKLKMQRSLENWKKNLLHREAIMLKWEARAAHARQRVREAQNAVYHIKTMLEHYEGD